MSYHEIEIMLTAIKDFIDSLNETIANNAIDDVRRTNEQYREAIKLVGEIDGRIKR